MTFHNGQMDGIPGGELSVTEHRPLGALDDGAIYWKNVIHKTQQRVEGGLDRLPATDCHVAVQNFLKCFCVCDQPLAVAEQARHALLGVGLMRVGRADQVHGDVGVNQDHCVLSPR